MQRSTLVSSFFALLLPALMLLIAAPAHAKPKLESLSVSPSGDLREVRLTIKGVKQNIEIKRDALQVTLRLPKTELSGAPEKLELLDQVLSGVGVEKDREGALLVRVSLLVECDSRIEYGKKGLVTLHLMPKEVLPDYDEGRRPLYGTTEVRGDGWADPNARPDPNKPRPWAPDPEMKAKRVDLKLVDTDIHEVLKMIAGVADVDIVASDKVTGTVTVELKDTPWDHALAAILSMKGLAATELKGVIQIVPPVVVPVDK